MQIEIKFSDLNDEAQRRILKKLNDVGLDPSDTNWDTNPMAIVNIEITNEYISLGGKRSVRAIIL